MTTVIVENTQPEMGVMLRGQCSGVNRESSLPMDSISQLIAENEDRRFGIGDF